MIKYLQYNSEFNGQIYDLFMEVIKEDGFIREKSEEEFNNFLFKSSAFKPEGTFVAVEGDKLVGFASGVVKDSDLGNENASGYIHTFFVKKEYRRQGIGKELLKLIEGYIKEKGLHHSRFVFLSGINWAWNIPHYPGHLHPGMPAVRINSEFYFFLLHNNYYLNSIHEGYHLPLAEYELPQKVVDMMKVNNEKGYTVEVYDPEKHYGIDEFCEAIDNPGFARSIQYNLKREKPLPFLVAAKEGRVVGWTGAMYTEPTGRGHLDGICVHPETRGTGLGKALFCYLCDYLKKDGSSYMTFFTGLDNPARKIYLYAGFKIAQSFADMKKKLD